MIERIKAVRQLLEKNSFDAFIVFSTLNIRYLTGFEASSGIVVVAPHKSYLLIDSRYVLKAEKEARGVEIVTVKSYTEGLVDLFSKKKFRCMYGYGIKAGFEEENISYKNFRKFTSLFPDIKFYPCSKVIESQRASKDRYEIGLIKKAVAITEDALLEMADFIRPGITEKEISDRLEDTFRRNGARWSGFRTIAAIPANASSPHSEPGEAKVPARGLVLVDAGCDYRGYNSDMTRMFLIGKMTRLERRVVETVIEAQKKAVKAIMPGKIAKEIDLAARDVIRRRGFGKYFSHGLGHGIGLGVHEEPPLSHNSNAILKRGMVITVEPGIYIPHRMGVRIEDMVLVTEKGAAVITNLPAVLKL
jgi:Xaa-Pro aminopeptidase